MAANVCMQHSFWRSKSYLIPSQILKTLLNVLKSYYYHELRRLHLFLPPKKFQIHIVLQLLKHLREVGHKVPSVPLSMYRMLRAVDHVSEKKLRWVTVDILHMVPGCVQVVIIF